MYLYRFHHFLQQQQRETETATLLICFNYGQFQPTLTINEASVVYVNIYMLIL